jgi:transposase
MIFRTRDLLVRQRTQLINALRGRLAEHGIVAAQELLGGKIIEVGKRRRREAARSETAVRLQSMPGIGPITAMAIEAFAPLPESWNCRTSMSQERQRLCTWKSIANRKKGLAPSPNT